MKNLFSIGEVSKIKGVTIKALRYYHKMGILIPRYIDEETGYRYYSIDQFIYIDIMKGCRTLGTSIVELQEIFKECNSEKLIEFLEVKKKEAENNIERMKNIIKNIDSLNSMVEYSKDILSNDEMNIKFIEKRYIVAMPCKEAGSLKELIYYSELEKFIRDKKIDINLERGIIYDFNLNGKVNPKYVFNGISKDKNLKLSTDNIKVLPEGEYLTLNYSKENEEERIDKIITYIKKNNFKVKTFVEIELFNDLFNIESYNCQMQILIE